DARHSPRREAVLLPWLPDGAMGLLRYADIQPSVRRLLVGLNPQDGITNGRLLGRQRGRHVTGHVEGQESALALRVLALANLVRAQALRQMVSPTVSRPEGSHPYRGAGGIGPDVDGPIAARPQDLH